MEDDTKKKPGNPTGPLAEICGPRASLYCGKKPEDSTEKPPPPEVHAKIESEFTGKKVHAPSGTWHKLKARMERTNLKAIVEKSAKEVVPDNLVGVTLKPVPLDSDERIAWVHEALKQASPRAMMELINSLYAKDAWSRYRASCEILDRAGFYKGADREKIDKSPMVVVNITAKDIWKAGVESGRVDKTIDVTPVKEEPSGEEE